MVPDGLGKRGAELWKALGRDAETTAGALALEACRCADRLDELDAIIAGKGVLRLMQFRVGDIFNAGDEQRVNVSVKFDSVLAEARQQQQTLRQLLVTLGIEGAASAPSEESPLAQVFKLVGGATKPTGGSA